jgi:hypothetical protein
MFGKPPYTHKDPSSRKDSLVKDVSPRKILSSDLSWLCMLNGILREFPNEISINDLYRGMLREHRDYVSNYLVISKAIICIKEKKNIARSCSGTLIHSMVYTPIRLTNKIAQVRAVALDYLQRSVSRPAIYDNVLYARVSLRRDTLNCCFNTCYRIEADSNDGDFFHIY